MKKLLIILSLILLTGCNYTLVDEEALNLRDKYKNYFDIGAAVTSKNIDKLNDEYTTITAEYEMKWDQIEPTKDNYNFQSMDIIAQYARNNNLDLRGHTIVWYQTTPDFIKDINNLNITVEEKMNLCLQNIEEYYKIIYQRYSDIITCFDVVNEVISDSNDLRETYRTDDPYYMMFNYDDEVFEEFIKEVYKIVQKVSPNVTRYYNDYFILNNHIKRTKTYNFISKINEDENLIEGMGAQSHVDISITQQDVSDTIDLFRKLNIEFSFTELDISVYTSPNFGQIDYLSVELDLAKAYNNIFSIARKNKDIVTNITFWGINDSMTWLDSDERKDYPLLFDIDGNKKYAYYVVMRFGV